MNSKDLLLFNEIAQTLFEEEEKNPIVKPIPISSLYETLDLSLPDEAPSEIDFKNALQALILNTPRTSTKLFFNQLFGGRNGKSTLGELLSVLLNNSMYTYKVGGPMIGIEKLIIHKIASLVGYKNDFGGTLAAGGSMTNFMAMIMGRDAFNKKIKQEGVTQTMVLYTSKESHYSIPKNATFMGVGRQNVRYIKSNEYGQMDIDDLEVQIQKDLADGLNPFFVNATANTTVIGAFDPFEAIAAICKKYKLWFHIDGAYGGSVLFSKKYNYLLKGAALSDSFSINAHKMLGTPLACSMIVVKDKQHLYHSFANEANYLYQGDNDDYNPGKISLQCGRRNDALKFWTLWKAIGTNGLGEMVDKQFTLADVARDYIRKNSDYTLYSFDNSVNVCFNYKGIPADVLCQKLYETSTLMVGHGQFKETQFVRFVTINSGNEPADILNFFKVLEIFVEENF